MFAATGRGIQSWLVLTFPLIWFGIGRRYPWAALGPHGILLGKIFWVAVTLAWLFGLVRFTRRPELERWAERAKPFYLAGAIALLPAYDCALWRQFHELGYVFPKLLLATDAAIAIAAVALWKRIARQGKNEGFLLFTMAVSLLHLAVAIFQFPLTPVRSDMLPMIDRAVDLFLQGKAAYESRFNPVYRIPFLPLTWLAFLPAHLLGIDSRWICVLCRAILGALVWRRFRGKGLALLLFGFWFLDPYLLFRHELYLDPYWLVVFLSFDAALRGRGGRAFAGAAVLIGMSQWGWVLFPFVLLLAIRPRRLGALAIAVAGLFVLDGALFGFFYHREGAVFVEGVFQYFQLIGTDDFYSELCLGLASPFLATHTVRIMVWLQRGMLLAGGTLALWRWWKGAKNVRSEVLKTAVFTVVAFMCLNPLLENYFYLTPILLAGFLAETG